jgi:hypothetical protein
LIFWCISKCIEYADVNALEPLTKLIAICLRCEDQVKFFESQCSNQEVFVSCAGLMLQLSSVYVTTLFIIKLKRPCCPWPVECVKIMFFIFFDNDPIELIFLWQLALLSIVQGSLGPVEETISSFSTMSVFMFVPKNVSCGHEFDCFVNYIHYMYQQRQIYNHGIIRQGFRNFVFLAVYSMQKHICAESSWWLVVPRVYLYKSLWVPDSVRVNSIFGFGGKKDRRSFETCSSHVSPRNEPMKTSF